MGKIEELKSSVSVRQYAEARLEPCGRSFVCPACGSGSHSHRTPALKIYDATESWYCHACGRGGDVLDLAGAYLSTDDRAEQMKEVEGLAGASFSTARRPQRAVSRPQTGEGREESLRYVRRCAEALGRSQAAIAYVQARGFTIDEARRFGFGYDEQERRLIIPYLGAGYYYNARAIDEVPDGQRHRKPPSNQVGEEPLFNEQAAAAGEPFFIVEGALDAYAVEACGFSAIACTTSSLSEKEARAVAHAMEAGSVAILYLDDDATGRDKSPLLEATLRLEGAAVVGPLEGRRFKDAAEWLANDRDALREWLGRCYDNAAGRAVELEQEARLAQLEKFGVVDLDDALFSLYELTDAAEPVPTGINALDYELNGGLPRGLVILGAMSSAGKTTLAVQLADNIAARGRSVLFVTIEQSVSELLSKSISRLAEERSGNTITALEIRRKSSRESLTDEKQTALMEAFNAYTLYIKPHMSIQAARGALGVSDVRNAAEVLRTQTGESPVVFVDYLQLLASADARASDKQAIDANVTALRQMARDMRTTVVVISSLNRSSYTGGVTMESFKESGAIEYSADLLLGLQAAGMDDATANSGSESQARKKAAAYLQQNRSDYIRDMELKILKNRDGAVRGRPVRLVYHALSSRFEAAKETHERPAI